MKFLRGLKPFSDLSQGTVACVGNFDGIHLGHRHLLSQIKKKSLELRLPSLVLFFEPQPNEYFKKNHSFLRLSSFREKVLELKLLGIDYVYCFQFNEIFAQRSAETFAHAFLFSLFRVKALLIGADFRFGNNREGSVELLKSIAGHYAAKVHVCPDYLLDGDRVSSTLIRQSLERGQLEHAARLLGRNYAISGRVVHGRGLARTWAVPTANIALKRQALPLQGVFCVLVTCDADTKIYPGVANIGFRPSFSGLDPVLEVHLFDFNDDLYGSYLNIQFIKKIRDEIKFESVDDLLFQIHRDLDNAKQFFNFLSVSP